MNETKEAKNEATPQDSENQETSTDSKMEQPSEETPKETTPEESSKKEGTPSDIKVPKFAEISSDKSDGAEKININLLLDVPLQFAVELGRANILVSDLLQMAQGSVIELEKLIGEPFDVLINNKLIARGEIVVINEKFGIRITDIVSPQERVEKLQ